jgi:SAM-dependent methyltransferase
VTEEMVRYYARRAIEYDRVYELARWQPGLEQLRGLVRRLFENRRVLEVACGTGYWTAQLAAVAARVCATDINEETLEVARARTAGMANVEVRQGDAYAAPAGPQTFDAGLAALWLSHVDASRMREFLGAFHTRLEPGAAVLMFDELDDATRSVGASRTDAAGNRYERRRLQSGEQFEIIKNLFEREQLVALLAPHATGLVYQDLGSFWAVTYRVAGAPAPAD